MCVSSRESQNVCVYVRQRDAIRGKKQRKGEGFELQVEPISKAFEPRSAQICFELASI